MFIKVTRSAAVSALAAGREVRLDTTGEIFQLEAGHSKRFARRVLTQFASWGYDYGTRITGKAPKITYSVYIP